MDNIEIDHYNIGVGVVKKMRNVESVVRVNRR